MSVVTDLMVIGTVRDYGDHALLLEFDSTAEVLAWTDAAREANLPGVVDIVPAARTVLIKLDAPRYQGIVRHRLGKLHLSQESVEDAIRPVGGSPDVLFDVV
jgi:allophanate hydrolase subunit 1